jgi:ABC-2 type transport system permease protein
VEWLLIPPLLLELYALCVGVGLLLAALYVRFRDVGQIWELAAQLLFFASAIFFPIGIVPVWAQKVAFLNPFLQIMQDARHAVLGSSGPNDLTVTDVYGTAGRLIPLAIVFLLLLGGYSYFRREARYFAERV